MSIFTRTETTAELVFSVVVFLLKFNFCLRYKYNLFILPHVLLKSNKTCYFSTFLTLLLLTMVSMKPYLLLTNRFFHCICLSQRGDFISVKLVKILKQKFASQLTVINLCICSLMKHTVSTNQSMCYIENLL